WAAFAILVAYALFEHNRLVFLVPFLAAAAWWAWRGWRGTGSDGAGTYFNAATVLIAVLALAHLAIAIHPSPSDVGRASVTGPPSLIAHTSPWSAPRVGLGNPYGPLAYELYVPAAAVLDTNPAEEVMAVLGHLLLAFAVFAVGRRIGWSRDRGEGAGH